VEAAIPLPAIENTQINIIITATIITNGDIKAVFFSAPAASSVQKVSSVVKR